jgi:hypothetical protein
LWKHGVDPGAAGVPDDGKQLAADPVSRTRGDARPPISNDCVSGVARAAATKAGAANSAEESSVQSPISEVKRPPRRGWSSR